MKTIEDFNFAGKKALIRVDFNVPLNDQLEITDDTRIKAALPTICKILDDGGSAILMSHLGRPRGGYEKRFSLANLTNHLQKLTETPVYFSNDCIGAEALNMKKQLQPGEILLLENLRFHKDEKSGDAGFARELSRLADLYVNDAFGTAHRAHASTAVIAQYFSQNKCAGLLIQKEVKNLEKVLQHHNLPFSVVLGGAKVSDKVGVIRNLLPRIDNLLIGGAMANTFIKARGGDTGSSKVENDKLELSRLLIKEAREKNVTFHFPRDSIIAREISHSSVTQTAESFSIPDGWMGLDIGPEAINSYKKVISESKTLLWNGPVGIFEMEPFTTGTREIGNAVGIATRHGAFSLIGGGDTVSAVRKFGIEKDMSFISTGGGALLEYLEGKSLPGIKALNKYT